MIDDDAKFVTGDRVEITTGAFAGFPGVIEDVDNDVKYANVRVEVSGRVVTVEIYLTDLKKSARS